MKITYPNGTVTEALVLSRGKNTLRAAVPGEDDARSFTLINGAWISEQCERVEIEFMWERRGKEKVLAEADCVCSKQLASRLISMLLTDTQEDDLIDNMLWVFSADPKGVRVQQSQLQIADRAVAAAPPDSALLN